MKLILPFIFILSLSAFAQREKECLWGLKIGKTCELGIDSITPIRVIMANQKDINELLNTRKLVKLTVTKEKSMEQNFSDKEVFTFEAGQCSVLLPECLDKAQLVIKRYYNRLMMDDVVYLYESSGVMTME